MKKIIPLLITLLYSSTALAQEAPTCPDQGSDPSQFCLPGMIWDNETKKCVAMV